MCAGSLIFVCCKYVNLNPLATIYSITLSLEQRVTTPDEEETHIDRFILQMWECAPDKASPGYLWRGLQAKQIAGDDLELQGHSGSREDELHLNGGPRVPSSTLGTCSTTGAVLQPIISTVTHQLILETTYSTYEQDDNGSWTEGSKLVASLTRKVTVSDCSISRSTIEIPQYIMTSQEIAIDPVKFLEPYTESTVPQSFSVPKYSSVIQDGKTVGKPKYHSRPSTSKQIRDHQLETNSFCLCFFEAAARYPPQGSGLNLVDTIDLVPDDEVNFHVERERDHARDKWRHENPQARQHIPGFMYVFTSDCVCMDPDLLPSGGEARRNPKVTYGPTATRE